VTPPTPELPEPIDWLDRHATAAYWRAVERHVHEAVAAGLDATTRQTCRMLTRREARTRIREAQRALGRLFFAARRRV
jgi:hypothetical protein